MIVIQLMPAQAMVVNTKSLLGFVLVMKPVNFCLNKAQVRDRSRATKLGSATQCKRKSGDFSPKDKFQQALMKANL